MKEGIFSVLAEMMEITIIGRAEERIAALTVIMTIITLIVGIYIIQQIINMFYYLFLGLIWKNR